MSGAHLVEESLRHAIELAGHAPSIHNSQPWRFVVGEQRIDAYADRERWLPATDADQRDLFLSCGAALHHLRVALASAGIGARVRRLPDPGQPELFASIDLGTGRDLVDPELSAEISRRRSDRRPFRSYPMPDLFRRQLVDRAADQGAVLRVIDDAESRAALVEAFAEAAAAQASQPGYVEELKTWTDTDRAEGIPAANLVRPVSPSVEAAREFGDEPARSYNAPPEEASLLVLGTASDDRLSQLRAGEAMSAVLLEATREGLASCPLTQPLEVAATREILQDRVLGGTLSPQAVLRIGWGPEDPLPPTPRRSLDEILGAPQTS